MSEYMAQKADDQIEAGNTLYERMCQDLEARDKRIAELNDVNISLQKYSQSQFEKNPTTRTQTSSNGKA